MNELITMANVFKDFTQQQIEGCPAWFCFFFFSEELKQYFFVASVSKTSEQFQMLLRLTSCQLF